MWLLALLIKFPFHNFCVNPSLILNSGSWLMSAGWAEIKKCVSDLPIPLYSSLGWIFSIGHVALQIECKKVFMLEFKQMKPCFESAHKIFSELQIKIFEPKYLLTVVIEHSQSFMLYFYIFTEEGEIQKRFMCPTSLLTALTLIWRITF